MKDARLIPLFASAAIVSLVTLALFSSFVDPQSGVKEDTRARRPFEGSWMWHSLHSVSGAGHSKMVSLRKRGCSWTIVITSIIQRRRAGGGLLVTKSVRGPFDAQIQDELLTYAENGEQREYTIRMENDLLVLPAIVQTDSKTWVFKSSDEYNRTGTLVLEYQCEHDPLVTPVGKATFPGGTWDGAAKFYVYERGEYSPTTRTRSRRLRFLERIGDFALHEHCELVFDDRGSPRYEGSGWGTPVERRYRRMSANDVKRVGEHALEPSPVDNEKAKESERPEE